MNQTEHYVQDACELLAVAQMQECAERLSLSKNKTSPARFKDFEAYVSERNLSDKDFSRYPQYVRNIETHACTFVERVADTTRARDLHFFCTERESRNNSLKGDFSLTLNGGTTISVSLKNYRNSIGRPQVSSGTFNSFALSFLLTPAPGVGMFYSADNSTYFRGSNKAKREQALNQLRKQWATRYLKELDALNESIKQKFVYSPEFEFLDETKFDAERKAVGTAGAEVVYELLKSLPPSDVRHRLVERIGFSGAEEQLMFDPARYTDSITVSPFRELIDGVRSSADFAFSIRGQGISFEFTSQDTVLLSIHVPFTINKNGAWISESYTGRRMHSKEGVALASGQRRPKKSKELATSVNTYLDLESTGIFLST